MKYNFEDIPPERPWNIYGRWINTPSDVIFDLLKSYKLIKKYFESKIMRILMLFLRVLHIIPYTLGWTQGCKFRATREKLSNLSMGCQLIKKRQTENENPPIDLVLITIGRRIVAGTLKAIDHLTIKPYTVIIIDFSMRRSRIIDNWIKKQHKFNIIVCRCKNMLPIWVARNIALKLSDNEYIAFLDDDCIPTRTWLEMLYSHIRKKEKIAAVSGTVYPLTHNPVGTYFSFYRIHEPPRDLTHITLNNAILRREAIVNVGGFRPLPFWGGEDIDLSFRLLANGYKLSYEPRGVVYHFYPASIVYMVKKFFMYGKAVGYLASQYGLEKPGIFSLCLVD